MTKFQASQILNLRKKGLGYRTIAAAVGLSRDSVRNYCKARNMAGYGVAASKNVEMMKECRAICHLCGGKVTQPKVGRPRRFCSDGCRREWWKLHPDAVNRRETAIYHLTCARCGAEFISYGNQKQKYCTHNCYIKARFWEGVEDGVSKD